jgi:hypothetical protein
MFRSGSSVCTRCDRAPAPSTVETVTVPAAVDDPAPAPEPVATLSDLISSTPVGRPRRPRKSYVRAFGRVVLLDSNEED